MRTAPLLVLAALFGTSAANAQDQGRREASTHNPRPIAKKAPAAEQARAAEKAPRANEKHATNDAPAHTAADQPPPERTPPRGGRARLGAVVGALDDTAMLGLAKAGVSPGRGIAIEEVLIDSVAHREGMLAGDLIVAVRERPIARPIEVWRALRDVERGAVVPVDVVRAGKLIRLRMKLDEGIVIERPGRKKAARRAAKRVTRGKRTAWPKKRRRTFFRR